MPAVIVGIDPHKHLNAVVAAVSAEGNVLAPRTFVNTTDGFTELRALGRQWRERTWAIEGCSGVGKHLSQRLLAAGEQSCSSAMKQPYAASAHWETTESRIPAARLQSFVTASAT